MTNDVYIDDNIIASPEINVISLDYITRDVFI